MTISLVPEARGGPFIFHGDLPASLEQAAALGYAAVEIFPPSADALDPGELKQQLAKNNLALAAIGTGGGWVRHKLTLTSANAAIREKARQFISSYIDFAANFGAAVIIGSMQGKAEGDTSRTEALALLHDALLELAERAASKKVTLLYEHLNRYETNLLNRIEEVLPFLAPFGQQVKILADLFHMSIEEQSISEALRAAGERLGHVHFADSNRRPAGFGHTDFAPIFQALREMNYTGYVSAEALPWPAPVEAARQTLRAFHRFASAPPDCGRASLEPAAAQAQ